MIELSITFKLLGIGHVTDNYAGTTWGRDAPFPYSSLVTCFQSKETQICSQWEAAAYSKNLIWMTDTSKPQGMLWSVSWDAAKGYVKLIILLSENTGDEAAVLERTRWSWWTSDMLVSNVPLQRSKLTSYRAALAKTESAGWGKQGLIC